MMATAPRKFFAATKGIEYKQDELESFILEKYNELQPDDGLMLDNEADAIIKKLKRRCATIKVSRQSILIAMITALYFEKFGEPPMITAVNASLEESG